MRGKIVRTPCILCITGKRYLEASVDARTAFYLLSLKRIVNDVREKTLNLLATEFGDAVHASKGKVRVIELLVTVFHWFSNSYFDYSAFGQAILFRKLL